MNKNQRWKGIMKAVPFEERRLAKWEPPYIVQPKYDGVRCRIVPVMEGKSHLLVSSEENVIHSVPHINKFVDELGLTKELDGELYRHGFTFEKISSITSRTVNLHPDYDYIQFHAFDVIEAEPQIKRIINLGNMSMPFNSLIHFAPFWVCQNLEEILSIYNQLISKGYEGIIVRHYLGTYERKRSTLVMKFKPKKEDIYEIVDYKEETSINGNPKGRLGALVCKGSDGTIFSVGSGFTDETKETLWSCKDSLSGKFARVQYQHITAKSKVPRFPIFVEVLDEPLTLTAATKKYMELE